MKLLQELAQLSTWAPSQGDQLKLYNLAMSGLAREEARQQFEISDKHFNVLYKKLKDQMANGVLHNSLKHLTRVQRIQFSIRKQYESSMILIQTGKKTSGIPLTRATIRKAEKYGLYQICLDLSRELRRYYGTVEIDKKLYRHYAAKQAFYKKQLECELAAEEVFFDLGFHYNTGLPVDEFEGKIKHLFTLRSESHRFHYMRFLSQVLLHQIKRREPAMIATCHDALGYFEGLTDQPYAYRFSFLYRLVVVYLAHQQYSLAESAINRTLDVPPFGRHNWQIIMLHRALLGFHSGKPAIALDTYRKAMKLPKKFRAKLVEERWQIIRAYLELYDIETPGTWRLRKFLNSMPTLSSDKSGQHVNVVILELLHLLKAKKFESYRYRCERVEAYISAHLKGKGLDRYICFLRLLHCVVRGGFQKEAVSEKGAKYLQTLQTTSPRVGADVREVEVVPFEGLWEMALGWL